MRLQFSARATQELDEIWTYTAQDNVSAAERMVDRIKAACRAPLTFPEMGRPDRAGARELTTAPPYVIIYRHRAGAITIERILHGARRR